MSALSAEISATCNALGYFDEKTNKYYADSNTLETVKDLIRYLRRDDEQHTIRRQLGQTKVLTTDLLPLLKNYHEENDLFDVLLRLIMNLTTPPLLLFNFEIPTDKVLRNYYLELEDHLKSYKEAFVDEAVWAVFSTHLSKVLDVDNAERGEENGVKIERILVLIRNVMFVSDDSIEKRPDNDASVHDQVLWALHHSALLDIILYITTNPAEQGYFMYILEIMFFMLKNQQPNELANAALQRSQGEKIRDEAELVNIRHTESNDKQRKTKLYAGTRHSRFGGTFVVQTMKSINDNLLISHKPLNKLDAINFDADKKKKKTPKNRAPLVNNQVDRRSAFTIRLFLKEFCIEFLNGAYNNVMQYIKGVLARNAGDNQDETYYLWALSFFMAFNRHYKFEVKLVSETLSVQIFHFVQQQCENYLDLMKSDRKRVLIWSKRLHTALLSYRELLLTLFVMDKSQDQIVSESSKMIKSNVFYLPEYREFIITLLMTYDELLMTDLYLKDLMETQHLFLKMFEIYCKAEGTVIVKKKSKSKKKKKANKSNVTELNLNEMWDGVSPQISAILESGGEFLTDIPFDAASETPIDEQKTMTMMKIQHKLRNSEYESAIGIMRAAREVWPENNAFGDDNMSSEQEFLSIREIFYADLGENTVKNPQPIEEDNNSEDDEEDEDEASPRNEEVSLDFKDFLYRLVQPKIIRTCALALKNFASNSVNTNHSILKLMHRIAFDCKCYVMMFQLSLFRTFQKLFVVKDLPQYKELVKFAIYILRQFFKITQKNDRVFLEVLFWTSKKHAFEIENGYGTNNDEVNKLWTEEEENELCTLFEEHKSREIEEDVVDWILSNLVKQTRTRRGVLKKLKALDLLDDYKKNKTLRRTNNLYWSTDEETRLRELYTEFKSSPDLLNCIMNSLIIPRPKNKVIEKMITLGLIRDKNEIKKKKQKSRVATSDSDSDSEPPVPTKRKNIQQKYTKIADKNEVTKILLKHLDKKEALDWLKESISDVLEDFEDDHEGIPLVPFSGVVENCMENEEFQELLSAIGFSKPLDEQESYWRFPGHIKRDTWQMFHDLIASALENNLVDDTNDGLDEEVSNKPEDVLLDDTSDSGLEDETLERTNKKRSRSPVPDSPTNKRSKINLED